MENLISLQPTTRTAIFPFCSGMATAGLCPRRALRFPLGALHTRSLWRIRITIGTSTSSRLTARLVCERSQFCSAMARRIPSGASLAVSNARRRVFRCRRRRQWRQKCRPPCHAQRGEFSHAAARGRRREFQACSFFARSARKSCVGNHRHRFGSRRKTGPDRRRTKRSRCPQRRRPGPVQTVSRLSISRRQRKLAPCPRRFQCRRQTRYRRGQRRKRRHLCIARKIEFPMVRAGRSFNPSLPGR